MNTLSWFMYFADTVGGVGMVLFLAAIIVLVGGLVLLGTSFGTITVKEYNTPAKHSYDYIEVVKFPWVGFRLLGAMLSLAGFFLMFVCVLIPSKQTLYMIAASQLGEQVIQLEQVQGIGNEASLLASDTIDLLRQKIGEQITPKKEE